MVPSMASSLDTHLVPFVFVIFLFVVVVISFLILVCVQRDVDNLTIYDLLNWIAHH